MAMVFALVLLSPWALRHLGDLAGEMNEQWQVVGATEADQQGIVRSYLGKEIQRPPVCDPSGGCPAEPVYFDRASAVLLDVDSPEPWRRHEFRTDEPEARVIELDRYGRSSRDPYTGMVVYAEPAPLSLQKRLAELVQVRIYHADPMLPGLIFVDEPGALPMLGPGGCSPQLSPRLVRISRAAVHKTEDLAIALAAITFCDGSGHLSVVAFRRGATGWQSIE